MANGKKSIKGGRVPFRSDTGLARLDLLAILFVVLILSTLIFLRFVGKGSRTAQCAQNLKVLSQLMHDYAAEHNDSLPPASIEEAGIAWDMQIAPYLPERRRKRGFETFFCCPADAWERTRPRSYAMPLHDMSAGNWPPGEGNKTGVGLVWNTAQIKERLGSKSSEILSTKSWASLPLVRLSSITSPADTAILTELFDRENNLKSTQKATVTSPMEQLRVVAGRKNEFHASRFNHLMADGHVELLSVLQTGSLDGTDGIWSINKGKK